MLQLLAMTDTQRAQVQAAMTQLAQVNTLQHQLQAPPGQQPPAPAPQNPPAAPTAAQAGVNLLTQLLNAPAQPNGQARLFNTTTRVVTDESAPRTRTRNPTIPKRTPLGFQYLLDTTDMEPSELATYEDLSLVSSSSVSDDQLSVGSTPNLVASPFDFDSSDDDSSDDESPDDDSSVGPPPALQVARHSSAASSAASSSVDSDSSIGSSVLPRLV